MALVYAGQQDDSGDSDVSRQAQFDDAANAHLQDYNNTGVKPTSVLQPVMMSGDGMSSDVASRRLLNGGTLSAPNGIAADTYQQQRALTLESPRTTFFNAATQAQPTQGPY